MFDHLSHVAGNSIQLKAQDHSGVPIEYPGDLEVYNYFGACGNHPQFNHLKNPPDGYYFVHSQKQARKFGLVRTLIYVLRFAYRCVRRGARLRHIYRFIRSRGLRWQRYMGSQAESLFFPSVPFHLDQFAWTLEIEDTTSLLYPFVRNGQTGATPADQLNRIRPIFQELLESPNCRAIISHMKSTVDSLPVLFESPELAKKAFHIPVGIPIPDWNEVMAMKQNPAKKGPIILFSNSWHQHHGGFYVRGGLDVLTSFKAIRARYPSARLILRSQLPEKLPQEYHAMIRDLGVEVVDQFLESWEWHKLRAEADYFVFPSARIHIVSLLEAMAYGMCVITSNGWGIEEYASHGRNAIIVDGRKKVTWIDRELGLLREDYTHMFAPDVELSRRLSDAFNELESDPTKKERLIRQARRDVEEVFTLERWNAGLKRVFDSVI